jgi:hypothetical protein
MKSSRQSTDQVTLLEALRRYELLNPSPDHTLDDLTAQVIYNCATPVFLPVLLVDEPGFTCKRPAQGFEC